MQSLTDLPDDLPAPIDDGLCNHLVQRPLPSLSLDSTLSKPIDLSALSGWLVIYCYPRTGQPNQPLPDGWDAIPGARGCTPQSCAFRDYFQEIRQFNAQVFGLSTQDSAYQLEVATRLHLPFPLLSDHALAFTKALNLPTFETAGMVLNKRLTLMVYDGVIQHVFYPVFPPNQNADDVIRWLKQHV
jgi:peroxiredoxin